MSYRALYRTYRPKTFKDVVGQDHIVDTLKNIIASNKVGHAYLFAGPRGTGKTSVAHVFARALNMNAAGNEVFGDMDIIEIDAASNNGVSEIRNIIESARYAPTNAKYKVYIIDEVHMLTKGAFNALLKTLEEPPVHVIFILATTEAHKLPVTILSRCQRFNFKRIDNEVIKKQIKNVLTQENISYDEEAIKFIADLSQGGMRDALSIADQASAFGNGVISFEAISQVFGVVSTSNQIKLINNAFAGDAKELMRLVNQLIDNGADIERVSMSLLSILKDYIVFAKTQDSSLLENITEEEYQSIKITQSYAYDSVEILMKLITDLRFTEVPKQSFELAILKMARSSQMPQAQVVVTKTVVETKEEDIFKTDTFSTVIKTEEVKQEIKVEAPAIVAQPISNEESIFDIMSDQIQEETQQFEVSDEILSTTEFSVVEASTTETVEEVQIEVKQEVISPELFAIEEPKQQVEEEIDLLKLFETPKTQEVQVSIKKSSHSEDEVLNLFLLSAKDKVAFAKEAWGSLLTKANEPRFIRIANLLNETRIIAAGENFVLVATENDLVAKQLFDEHTTNDFIEFSNVLFGRPTNIFTITKVEFDHVKNLWMDLSTKNELPTPQSVKAPKLIEKPKSEAEQLGTALFGDLFKI